MFILTFFSDFWRNVGKLWEARSRLYRSQSLQPNTHFATFFEIYKIFILLHLWNQIENHEKRCGHRSALKISAKFRQRFSHVCNFILKFVLIFFTSHLTFANFDVFSEFQQFVRKRSKSLRCSDFLGFRNEYFWNFQKMIFEKWEKKLHVRKKLF